MFSPEQEAQLDRWGCPGGARIIPLAEIEASAIRARNSGGFSSDSMPKGYRDARQPHDVLAWLNAQDEHNYYALVAMPPDIGASFCLMISEDRETVVWDTDNPLSAAQLDPYAASYALAEAVMEAK